MSTMVYTSSHTVVYNLFSVVVCVSFCLPVDMCYVFDVFLARMDMFWVFDGVRGEIQAASLSCVQQKGL